MRIFPGFGGAPYKERSLKVIRLLLKGCTNRPFFHISVQEAHKEVTEQAIEQIGSYDPFPNKYNEKLVAINFNRLEHWLRAGAIVSYPVGALLGLAGYFPIHPKTYEKAWDNRVRISKLIQELKTSVAELEKSCESSLLGSTESSSQTSSSTSETDSHPDGETPETPDTPDAPETKSN